MSLKVPASRRGSSRSTSTNPRLPLADRWHYDSSPPIPDRSEHYPYLILESKLRPRPTGDRDGLTPLSKAPHGIKREPSDDSRASQTIAKNRKISEVAVEVTQLHSIRHNSTVGSETKPNAKVVVRKNPKSPHDTLLGAEAQNIAIPGRNAISEVTLLRQRNDLLKRENDLLSLHRDRKMAALEEDVIHLQEANRQLNAMLGHFSEMEGIRSNTSGNLMDEVKELTTRLKQRDEQIEGKIHQIEALDEQLSAQERFQTILTDLQFDFTCSSRFSKELAQLDQGTRRVATFLALCLSGHQIKKLRKKPRRQPELDRFLKGTIGTASLLVAQPAAAIRALMFGFVRDRIFLSDCWTALHFEGYMLRELQQVIEK